MTNHIAVSAAGAVGAAGLPRWRGWWSRAREIRPQTLVLVLTVSRVALKLALLPTAIGTQLIGDEVTYNAAARTLAGSVQSVLSGDGLPLVELRARVVGYGWFMPGMSLVLTPLYLVAPGAGSGAVRLYVGVLTTALFLFGVRLIARAAGRKYAAALLVFPGLAPLWVLFSFTIWGDLSAGLMLIVLVAVLVRLWRRLRGSGSVRLIDGAVLGAVLAATLYMRSSALPLVLAVLALALTAGRAVVAQASVGVPGDAVPASLVHPDLYCGAAPWPGH